MNIYSSKYAIDFVQGNAYAASSAVIPSKFQCGVTAVLIESMRSCVIRSNEIFLLYLSFVKINKKFRNCKKSLVKVIKTFDNT